MIGATQLFALLVLIAFATLILIYTNRLKTGLHDIPYLRPIAAFEGLKNLLTQGVEANRRFHLSLGSGDIIQVSSAETLAGLTALEYIAAESANADHPPLVTMTDPATMLLAQNTVRQAYGDNTQGAIKSARQIRWISPEPAAYAAGVMGALHTEAVLGNVMIGHFGDEYLLIAESAHQQDTPVTTIAGAGDPNILPFVYATSPQGLWGEEMFAAGAYLSRKPAHIASLLAQDTLRWLVGLGILGGVLLKSLGLF